MVEPGHAPHQHSQGKPVRHQVMDMDEVAAAIGSGLEDRQLVEWTVEEREWLARPLGTPGQGSVRRLGCRREINGGRGWDRPVRADLNQLSVRPAELGPKRRRLDGEVPKR